TYESSISLRYRAARHVVGFCAQDPAGRQTVIARRLAQRTSCPAKVHCTHYAILKCHIRLPRHGARSAAGRVNKGPRLQIIEAGNHIDNCGLLKLDHTPSTLAWRRLDDQVLDVITRRASLSSAMRHKEDVGMRGVELG